MPDVLLIADHDGKALNAGTHRALTCAKELGEVDVVVFHAGAADVVKAASKLDWVTKVVSVDRPENAHPVAAVLAPQVAKLAQDYDYVLAPSPTFGKDLLPRVAALLGAPQVSDLMEIVDKRTFKRPIYAGNVITTVTVPEGCKVLATVRIASFPAAASGDASPVEETALDVSLPGHTTYHGLADTGGSDRPDLQSAARVVAGGRGVGSQENFAAVFQLADRLGAAVGATRAAVDAGYVPNDMQIGQTGKIIAPDLYIGVGISGAIQHMTGIKDAGLIVAINKDAEAPIFEAADIGLVGDLFQVLPQIEAELDK